MNKPTVYILALLCCLVLPAEAQQKLSLQECIETGLEKNYQIRMARNEQEISDRNVSLGNAGYLPQLRLNAGASGSLNNTSYDSRTGGTEKVNGSNVNTLSSNVGLTYTLFNGFTVRTTYQRLKELQSVGELATRQAVESFIADLAAQYYNVVRQQMLHNNLLYTLDLSRQRLNIVQARYELGASSKLDVLQAQVDFNRDSSRLVQQYETMKNAFSALNTLLAEDNLDTEIQPADEDILFAPDLNYDELLNRTMEGNATLGMARHQQQISSLDLRIQEGQAYPTVSLTSQYGYSSNLYNRKANANNERQSTLGLSYGATVGFNLFSGGDRRRMIRNARTSLENQQLSYLQTEQRVRSALLSEFMSYENNKNLLSLALQNLETSHENYDTAMERYRLGELSGIELREVQENLHDAEESVIDAKYQVKLAEISLQQISASITDYMP